jgi:hypothetical protein
MPYSRPKRAPQPKDPIRSDSTGVRSTHAKLPEFAFGERPFFQPLQDKVDAEALRDWENEGGASVVAVNRKKEKLNENASGYVD